MKETSAKNLNSQSPALTERIKAFGCAAKISAADLESVISNIETLSAKELLTGMEHFEDAACWQISADQALVQTVDFFPALLDDPYLFGQIAAVNALSDVYAMGGRPILALNIVVFPACDFPKEVLGQILQGGAIKIKEAGAVLAGGHTIAGADPIYGLSVTGLVHPQKIWTNSGACASDLLVLTKPLGSGIGLTALKAGLLSDFAKDELLSSLSALNKGAADCARRFLVHAATDVSGFGLFGHVHEMAKASRLKAQICLGALPLFPEVLDLASQGILPAALYANRNSYQNLLANQEGDFDLALIDLLFDPQTAGGLLFALDEENARALIEDLRQAKIEAAIIGRMQDGASGSVEVVSALPL